jgi:hypothetical protein
LTARTEAEIVKHEAAEIVELPDGMGDYDPSENVSDGQASTEQSIHGWVFHNTLIK